jgi:hypothetical protein
MSAVFIFIDESGDPGNILQHGASSPYYAELALQINKDTFRYLAEHVIAWQYILGRFDEVKTLPSKEKELKRYVDPLIGLCDTNHLCCSCVYLIKAKYQGPYFQVAEHNPAKFRNFVHRQLLEHHFQCFPTDGSDIELVFDRYRMSKDEMDNLEKYLRNNWNLPTFGDISHINSKISGVMQTTSQLVSAIKDIILGTADGKKRDLLSFIKLKDITAP